MMWNDWEKTVRAAAAQALGRTGNGKVFMLLIFFCITSFRVIERHFGSFHCDNFLFFQLVHDALLKRLLDSNERIQADALRKVSSRIV